MTKKNRKSVLSKLRRNIESLERSQQDLHNPRPGRLRDIINNIAVNGRATTNILQGLRHIVEGFDDWYSPIESQMRNDELLKFFYEMRSASLKEGDDGIAGVIVKPGQDGIALTPEGITYLVHKSDGTTARILHPKPPNAISTFLGDSEGGSGWVVRNPDGKESKVYIPIPRNAANISLKFSAPPKTHLGNEIKDTSPENLCDLYIAYLSDLVERAESRFATD